jgi:hypothetical protein
MDAATKINIIISAIAAGSTFLAVVTAIALAFAGIRENRKQVAEERRQQNRPIIVPLNEISLHTNDGFINWGALEDISLTLRNMGNGVAFEIHSVFDGPEGDREGYSTWHNGPLDGKSEKEVMYRHNACLIPAEETTIDGKNLLYDNSQENYRIARLTTTYRDLFGDRHVSIFDYLRESPSHPTWHRWQLVTITPNIKVDLNEMNAYYHRSVDLV